MSLKDQIFTIKTEQEFNDLSLKIFEYQFKNNLVYQEFCKHLNVTLDQVNNVGDIPFLPIEFFKTHEVKAGKFLADQVFLSSGTTGDTQSKHFVKDVSVYESSYFKGFESYYGSIEDYCVLALLPSYLEREGSSLIYMVDDLIKKSKNSKSGFFLKKDQEMIDLLKIIAENGQKTILFGVSFALLGLAETYKIDLSNVIIMETGGMKGRREELTRTELHSIYKKSFNVTEVHSEYGMTELLSQAYSTEGGIFRTPNWMKVLIRDVNDPMSIVEDGKTGGINVIDLANINSCSFIATQDLGKKNDKEGFEVLGRFDNSDLRGCNLLIS